MTPTEISTRIHQAIQPQLDRCDELLDHYTEGLPREAWQSIADDLNPAIGVMYVQIGPDLTRWRELVL